MSFDLCSNWAKCTVCKYSDALNESFGAKEHATEKIKTNFWTFRIVYTVKKESIFFNSIYLLLSDTLKV